MTNTNCLWDFKLNQPERRIITSSSTFKKYCQIYNPPIPPKKNCGTPNRETGSPKKKRETFEELFFATLRQLVKMKTSSFPYNCFLLPSPPPFPLGNIQFSFSFGNFPSSRGRKRRVSLCVFQVRKRHHLRAVGEV